MKKSLLCLIPCALCLAAQEEPIRITVYASRIEDDKADMPVAVQTFDAAEIAASGARDLPDLLEMKAYFYNDDEGVVALGHAVVEGGEEAAGAVEVERNLGAEDEVDLLGGDGGSGGGCGHSG